MNQVTRHPSSIGSDKPSKDPEIRQVRKLLSNAQKVKKEFKKKQKAKGTGQNPTLKLNLPYPETVCCLFKEANHETIKESSGMQASKNPPQELPPEYRAEFIRGIPSSRRRAKPTQRSVGMLSFVMC